MPSTVHRKDGTGGRCSACHWEVVKRNRATPQGRASATAAERRQRVKLKAETIAAYGGKCACCGESEPVFLTVDHVNNDGGGRKREVGGGVAFYRLLRRLGFPTDGYRLLCFNCNSGRQINGGVCPHEASKEQQWEVT